ncbi:MAG: Sensor histidine kinase RcsC [Turneriella sp.]|nr:Sensor histidine kinase RcsC [Turneriella sp.]
MKSITRLLLLFFLLFLSGCTHDETRVVATKGYLDLSAMEFNNSVLYRLEGEWEYFPNQIVTPEEIAEGKKVPLYAEVPKSFNTYEDKALRLPATASATYRLRVKMPSKTKIYALRIPPPASASRIFINGNLEAQSGLVSQDIATTQYGMRLQYLQLPLADNTEIVIQVTNAYLRNGGISHPISLGVPDAVANFRLLAVSNDVFLVVALFTLGLYFIALVLFRNPDKSALYYGLFCIGAATQTLFLGERLGHSIFAPMPWPIFYRIEAFIYFADALAFYFFFQTFFPEAKKSKSLKALALVNTIFIFSSFILPLEVLRVLKTPFQFFIGLCIIFIFYYTVKFALYKIYGARLFLLGFIIVSLGFTIDALRGSELVAKIHFFPYAVLIFTLLLAILISARMLLIHNENISLSQQLLEADKLKDEFFEQTSHELRMPIQAMVQTLENIRRGSLGALAEKVQQTLLVVEDSGRRLLFLIDDITEFVKLKHSRIRLNLERVSLKQTVTPIFRLALGFVENRPLSIIDEIPNDMNEVQIDPTRFQQILLNLLSTAIRFAHSPTITVKIEVVEKGIVLRVEYRGAEPNAAFVFTNEKRPSEVGALVVERLTNLMHGNYFYQKMGESQHALCIFLPIEMSDDLKIRIQKAKDKTEYTKTDSNKVLSANANLHLTINHSNGIVLLVSDDANQIRLLQDQLASIGISSIAKRNGAEVLGILENENSIALIICDILLPDISGIDLTRNIRLNYDIGILPVILISGNNQDGIAASAFAAGANDLIRRPFEKIEVLARVKNVLLQREASFARENYRSLNRELEIARDIQQSILPIPQPKNSFYKIEAVCIPARSIGGDLYDFIEGNNTLGILLADVAGHGIPAALYAAMLKIAFHNLRDKARYPEKLLKSLNEVLLQNKEPSFISCTYTFLDFKNKRLLHANAGHLPLLLQEPNQTKVNRIQPPGSVLGINNSAMLTVEMTYLKPGMRLTLFTDGVVELVNRKGEFFEEAGLIQVLEEMRKSPLAALKDELLQRMHNFGGTDSFLDDITFLIIDV